MIIPAYYLALFLMIFLLCLTLPLQSLARLLFLTLSAIWWCKSFDSNILCVICNTSTVYPHIVLIYSCCIWPVGLFHMMLGPLDWFRNRTSPLASHLNNTEHHIFVELYLLFPSVLINYYFFCIIMIL